MYQDERLQKILDYLGENKRITVNKMMDLYGISRDTARRDLVRLEENGEIVRTRGGAMRSLPQSEIHGDKGEFTETNFESEELHSIVRKTTGYIKPGGNLMIDSSTAAQYLSRALNVPSVVVITNSLKIVRSLTDKNDVDIYLLGGKVNKKSESMQGASLLADMERFHVDMVFLGADGIDLDGITYSHEEEGMIARAMTKRGRKVILLAESSSFGKKALYKSLSVNDIDMIITDDTPESEFVRLLKDAGVELIVV